MYITLTPLCVYLYYHLHDEHIYIYKPLSIPWNLDKYENTKSNFFQVYNYEFHKDQLIIFFYTIDKVDLLLLKLHLHQNEI